MHKLIVAFLGAIFLIMSGVTGTGWSQSTRIVFSGLPDTANPWYAGDEVAFRFKFQDTASESKNPNVRIFLDGFYMFQTLMKNAQIDSVKDAEGFRRVDMQLPDDLWNEGGYVIRVRGIDDDDVLATTPVSFHINAKRPDGPKTDSNAAALVPSADNQTQLQETTKQGPVDPSRPNIVKLASITALASALTFLAVPALENTQVRSGQSPAMNIRMVPFTLW